MMDISIPYYEDRTRISNSNIGWFLNKGPAYLHRMLTDPPPEESSVALERGTMIHEYLLQPEEFQKDYVVWDKSRPSSAQQEKFCQALVNSIEIEPNKAVLSAYKQCYSVTGKSEDKMLSEGLKIASTLKDYIDFLKSNDQRKMISIWDVKMLEKIKQNIQSHKLASKLLEAPALETTEPFLDVPKPGTIIRQVSHEFHINWEFEWNTDEEDVHVHCKSLLDSVTFDFKNKVCTIMDLKTTQKLWHFEDSMEQYDYMRQLAYYMMAAKWYLKNECNEDASKWTFKFYIIGIDTTGSYDIRVFKFDVLNMIVPTGKIIDALIDIDWHISNNKWEHSRSYYEGDGSETLKL